MKRLVLAGLMALGLAAPVLADEPAKEIEALAREYIRLWNAGDAEAITSRIYRFSTPGGMGDKAGLQRQFDSLQAQGYHHSDTISIEGCLLSRDRGLFEMRYRRMKTDGTPLQADGATLYMVRRFPEGWRITELIGMNYAADLNCKSAPAAP